MNALVSNSSLIGFLPAMKPLGGPLTVHISQLSTNSETVRSIAPQISNEAVGGDFMCRVKIDSSTDAWVATVKTKDFQAVLHSAIEAKDADIWRLKAVALWLKTRLDYQAIHTAYLMGSMEEDEFVAEAEKYSTEYKHLDPRQIVTEIVECSRLLNFELSAADYADFLGVEVDSVLNVANKLGSDAKRILLAGSAHES